MTMKCLEDKFFERQSFKILGFEGSGMFSYVELTGTDDSEMITKYV